MRVLAVLDHAQPAVAERVAAVQQASYAVEAELIGSRAMPGLNETAEEVARLDLTVLGAEDDGVLVGLLGYRRVGDVVDIDRLAVHPAAFRRGVARSLVGELHAREADAVRFDVSTGADNEPAIRLYLGMGYRWSRNETIGGLRITHFTR